MRTPKATRATPVTATATGRNGMRVVEAGDALGRAASGMATTPFDDTRWPQFAQKLSAAKS